MSARGLTNVDLALLWDRLLCLNGAHALELLHSLCRVQAVKVLCCVVPIESLQDSCTYTTVSARVRACRPSSEIYLVTAFMKGALMLSS